MPRIRSVHPELCDDDVLAGVSAYAERTWIRLWTHLDDKGRGLDSAKLWAGKLYPLHDSMTAERVEKDLAELEAKGLLQRYEVDGKRYLCCKLAAWERWQRPQHPTPSKLPEPPPHGGLREPLMSVPVEPHPVVVGRGVDIGEEFPTGRTAPEPPPVDIPEADYAANTEAARAIRDALRRNPLSLVGEG